ncbi:MAG: caspase family protein [Bacteroidales bacterium]|nr:caspase family protein [Bacteroidales bacterium]
MKKSLLLTCLCLALFSLNLKCQKVVSGKSPVTSFTMQAAYERGLPPNLFAELRFSDDNGNGIVESEENAKLILILTNKGNGVAQGLEINVIEQLTKDSALTIANSNRTVPYLFPGKSIELDFDINAGFNIRTAEHKFKISVLEHFGYDMDPAYLVLNTLEYQKPKLVFAGYDVVDYGEGTSNVIQDGQIQPGEWVKLKMMVQNTGNNVATTVRYKVECKDENIYMDDTQGTLQNIAVGEVKYFWLTVSPNKRISPEKSLPLSLTLNVDRNIGGLNNYSVPIAMNQSPPAANILEVKSDWEKLQKQAARFEYSSNKFVTKMDSIINIREIPPSKSVRNDAVAIVFGIENYDELPPAPYAENDARLMKEYFQNCLGIKKVVVYNSKLARGLIFDDVFNPEYGELQRAIIKGKTDVFVYYSGHGIPSKEGNQLFLFPSDGKKERLELQGYNLSKLYENLDTLGARSVMVFLDACFSGASRPSERIKQENLVAMKGIRIKPDLYKPWEDNPNFSVFTSSGPGETSLAFDISQTGLFTYYLCAGLQGNADVDKDGKITSGELSGYVRDQVTNISRKISGVQTPEFHGNENTVLVEYK